MTADNSAPSETSLLLPKTTEVLPEPGNASQGTLPTSTGTNGSISGLSKPQDEELQDDDAEREVQYQGMPEVRKRLPYILPALAIGVCLHA